GSRGVSVSAPPAAATHSRKLPRDEELVWIDAFTLHLVGLVTVPTSANTAKLPGTPPPIKESISPADVLVIDEPDVRRHLTVLLGREGHRVATAATGRRGCGRGPRRPYDGNPNGSHGHAVTRLHRIWPDVVIVVRGDAGFG